MRLALEFSKWNSWLYVETIVIDSLTVEIYASLYSALIIYMSEPSSLYSLKYVDQLSNSKYSYFLRFPKS